MTLMKKILYCHARKGARSIDPGHWFFDTGQYAICAAANCVRRGQWSLDVYYEVHNKPLANSRLEFKSVDECKAFVSGYFGGPVVNVSVRKLPSPDNL